MKIKLSLTDSVIIGLPIKLDRWKKHGNVEFCEICTRCVNACPVNTINKDVEESFEIPGPI